VDDAVAFNLFKNVPNKVSPLPQILAGVNQNPDHKTPRSWMGSLWDGAKHMLSKAWQNRDTIGSIISNGAKLAALLGPCPDAY